MSAFSRPVKTFVCSIFIYGATALCTTEAQVSIQATEGGLKGEATSYMFYGTGAFSERIPYTKIRGSAFWSDDYKMASLYSGNKRFSVKPLKLNLASKEIYFLKNDEEQVLQSNDVTKLIFYKGKDTSTVEAVFEGKIPNLLIRNVKIDHFVQVLNSGKYELLKYVNRKVASADSLFRTQKRYFFTDEVFYFLRSGETVNKLKKLNKDELLSLLPSSSSFAGWLLSNKINLKKEDQVILFLNYYNENRQQNKNLP